MQLNSGPPPLPPPLPGDDPAAVIANELPASRPWGVWSTIGWSFLIVFCYVMAQGVVLLIFAAVGAVAGTHGDLKLEELENSALVLSVATIVSAPLGVGLCILVAWLRKGISVHEYLCLRWARWRVVISWLGVIVAFGIVTDLLTTLVLHRPLVPEVMVDLYRSPGVPALLWLAIVVAGPVVEEFMFRGFLLTGLIGIRPSRVRELVGIIVSSLAWALIHVQYDFYGKSIIFFAGLVLGYARTRAGSLWLCIVMHMLMNIIASLEVVLLMI